jgi:hypothetical protein
LPGDDDGPSFQEPIRCSRAELLMSLDKDAPFITSFAAVGDVGIHIDPPARAVRRASKTECVVASEADCDGSADNGMCIAAVVLVVVETIDRDAA